MSTAKPIVVSTSNNTVSSANVTSSSSTVVNNNNNLPCSSSVAGVKRPASQANLSCIHSNNAKIPKSNDNATDGSSSIPIQSQPQTQPQHLLNPNTSSTSTSIAATSSSSLPLTSTINDANIKNITQSKPIPVPVPVPSTIATSIKSASNLIPSSTNSNAVTNLKIQSNPVIKSNTSLVTATKAIASSKIKNNTTQRQDSLVVSQLPSSSIVKTTQSMIPGPTLNVGKNSSVNKTLQIGTIVPTASSQNALNGIKNLPVHANNIVSQVNRNNTAKQQISSSIAVAATNNTVTSTTVSTQPPQIKSNPTTATTTLNQSQQQSHPQHQAAQQQQQQQQQHTILAPLNRKNKNLSEKKIRRLEKNRLSARNCRRKKKEVTQNLQREINILEGENLRLRLQLQIGQEAEQLSKDEQDRVTEGLDSLLKSGASDSEIYLNIEEFKEKYADYGRDRRSAIDFHLRNVERLLMPTTTTTIAMRALDGGGGGASSSSSATTSVGNSSQCEQGDKGTFVADLSQSGNSDSAVNNAVKTETEAATIQQNPTASSIKTDEDKNSQQKQSSMPPKSLFHYLVKYLEVTPTQAAALKDSRHVAKELDSALVQSLKMLQELRERLTQCTDDLDAEFTQIRSILTPRQAAKFLVWVANNGACMHMLNELWSRQYPEPVVEEEEGKIEVSENDLRSDNAQVIKNSDGSSLQDNNTLI